MKAKQEQLHQPGHRAEKRKDSETRCIVTRMSFSLAVGILHDDVFRARFTGKSVSRLSVAAQTELACTDNDGAMHHWRTGGVH